MSNPVTRNLFKAGTGLLGIFLLFAILIAGGIIVSNLRIRKDLTQDRIYTLSDGSRAVLGKLDKTVALKLFFNSSTPEVPANIKDFIRRVEDLLAEYKSAADSRIVIEKYDPTPDSDAEEWAQQYGLPGQPIGYGGPVVYMGLVAKCGEEERAIPVLDPQAEELLEYNVTRLIGAVVNTQKPVVGVLSSLPVMGSGPGRPLAMPSPDTRVPWVVFKELKQSYTLRTLAATADRIDSDINTLVLVHPKELSDTTLYAIDQFVLRGGRLLAMVDPMSMADLEASREQQQPYGMPKVASDLQKLCDAWGITCMPEELLADMQASTELPGPGGRTDQNPAWLSLGPENVSRTDILTARIGTLMLPFATSFAQISSGSNLLTMTPLIFSSTNACGMPTMALQMGSLANDFRSAGRRMNLAVRLAGTFKTAFPGGKPKEEAATEDKRTETQPDAGHLVQGTSTVILVGDVDMIADNYCVQQYNIPMFQSAAAYNRINDNLAFFENAVEQLAGAQELIGIRARGQTSRPFDRVLSLHKAAVGKWQTQQSALQTSLRETQEKLREIESMKKDSQQKLLLNDDQKKTITEFQEKEREINRNLKAVSKSLTRDVDRLGLKVKATNILLMPVLVGLAGIAYGIHRKQRN